MTYLRRVVLGVSERYYYKLLKRFAPHVGGRYQVDHDVNSRIRGYLQERDKHADVMDLLLERGFNWSAARKWLQRHSIQEAPSARPRSVQELMEGGPAR